MSVTVGAVPWLQTSKQKNKGDDPPQNGLFRGTVCNAAQPSYSITSLPFLFAGFIVARSEHALQRRNWPVESLNLLPA